MSRKAHPPGCRPDHQARGDGPSAIADRRGASGRKRNATPVDLPSGMGLRDLPPARDKDAEE